MSQLDAQFELTEHENALSLGPFGILRVDQPQKVADLGLEQCENTSMYPDWEDFIIDDFSAQDATFGIESPCADGSGVLFGPYDNNVELSLLPSDFDSGPSGPSPTPGHLHVPCTTSTQLLAPPIPQLQRQMLEEYAADLADVDAPSIRLLLNRYQENLVPAFAPAQVLPKSLWQTVHIPRVHETLGEIMIKGDSDNSRVALFFAILSAASFYLDNTARGANQRSQLPWKRMGEIFRQRAKIRLVSSLKSVAKIGGKEGYKDMLLALLSMVTVGVSLPG